MINVVTERLLFTSSQIWTLRAEAHIFPICVEGHCLCYAHRKDEMSLPPLRRGSSPNDPIANHRDSSNDWLTSSERANLKKWIWGEAIVARNYIRVELQQSETSGNCSAGLSAPAEALQMESSNYPCCL
jgi:hypothetical protein